MLSCYLSTFYLAFTQARMLPKDSKLGVAPSLTVGRSLQQPTASVSTYLNFELSGLTKGRSRARCAPPNLGLLARPLH